jgi:hypothetical protein
MPDEPRQILVTDPEFAALCKRRAVARRFQDGETPVWVRSLTFGEWYAVRKLACGFVGKKIDEEPPAEALLIAQAVFCVRAGEADDAPAFMRVDATGEKVAYAALRECLDQAWVQTVCAECNSLCMNGYVPRKGDGKVTPGARRNLREALNDRAVWAALDVLSLKWYGVPLTRNGEPIGDVLSAFEVDQEKQDALAEAVGSLTGV